ncbi:hypothetical protein ACX1NX_12835 [Acinetobacter sp. ANC 5383]
MKIKWDLFFSGQYSDYDHFNIVNHLNNMRKSVEYKLYDTKNSKSLSVIRDKVICEKYEILRISIMDYMCIINPYQIDEKIYMLDLDNLAIFLFDNRNENNSTLTKNDFLDQIKKLVEDINVIIDQNDLGQYFKEKSPH